MEKLLLSSNHTSEGGSTPVPVGGSGERCRGLDTSWEVRENFPEKGAIALSLRDELKTGTNSIKS